MSLFRIAGFTLAAVLSVASFAGTASARDAGRVHVAAPHRAAVQECHVERVKIRKHGKIVTVKKRVCEKVAPRRHHRR